MNTELKGQKVTVAAYEHKYGTDVRVFATALSAELWRQEIAQDNWESEIDSPMPEAETPEQIANLYFDRMAEEGEFFSAEEQKTDALVERLAR